MGLCPAPSKDDEESQAAVERAAKRAKAGLSPEIIEELTKCNNDLSTKRKARKVTSGRLAGPSTGLRLGEWANAGASRGAGE